MKQIIYIALFFISSLSYGQNTGSIQGNLLDFESNNEPLILAKVVLKETGAQVLTDDNGIFKFEKLNNGEYTLVSSFVGYDTKETKITVASDAAVVKVILEPSTLSLEDLMATMASADNSASASNN
ncbi:MAG: carboxypeptidase-like regulatory domain-containing protein [Algibacter sp.]|uniref:carboxypeptidase-like regulatory domain-containing protein n=1 Tax=Algibacter sp. TaxID=1872428 RepID=UPI0032983696